MTRELVGLEAVLASVDINNSYATYRKSRNKSQIPDAVEENNLSFTQVSNIPTMMTATPSHLHSLSRDSLGLVSLSNTCQNSTKTQCCFHCL